MITVINYPERKDWDTVLQRPGNEYNAERQASVAAILKNVKENGDAAVQQYNQLFDGHTADATQVTAPEIVAATAIVSDTLKAAIDKAIHNIMAFHITQSEKISYTQTTPGIMCWRRSVGIEKVGLYIPGGTAPLFSTLLMLAIPATIAGCKEIIVCTPPSKDGSIHPAILYAAARTGVHKIFKAGGAQAIAAMAYGTETIPQVYKIFGPGNAYVTTAKMLLAAEGIAIDLPAGPSELAILADDSCNPAYVAADLLSQAEHGTDSQVLLVSDSQPMIAAVNEHIREQLAALPRQAIAAQALNNSRAILVQSLDEGMELMNTYAPEHLVIACHNTDALATKVVNAGSVFLGNYAPESAGDYASGTNHTLPTNGYAKAYSGVSLDSFTKKITFQRLTKEGLENIADTVRTMAMAEGLYGHANAITVRLNDK